MTPLEFLKKYPKVDSCLTAAIRRARTQGLDGKEAVKLFIELVELHCKVRLPQDKAEELFIA